MPEWHGKSRGTPLGYRIFVAILRNFGVAPAYVLLRFVTFYYVFFSLKSTKAVFALFRNRLGKSRVRSVIMLFRNYYWFGQSIIDKVVLMAGIPNAFTFHFDGEENLHDLVAQQKGGLLLSAHIGNWEIAGHLLKRLKAPINIVMFSGEHEQIKAYLGKITGALAVKVILIKNDISHIYEIAEAFQRNELVCMHADRFLEGNKTITVQLLGEPAKFPVGPFLLAAKFRVPVSFVFAMKESSKHYHFFASRSRAYDSAARNEVIQHMTNDFANAMEEKVRAYPEQWYNYYNFWQS